MATLKEIKTELKKLRLTSQRQKAGLVSWKSRRNESVEEAKWRQYSYEIFNKISVDLDKIVKEFGGGKEEVIEIEAGEDEVGAIHELPLPEDAESPAAKAKASARINIQRYKGLGEMNPQQLWDTTMNPETRIMMQVNVDDAALANETFEMLMGSDVAPRKHFIQTHAKKVENLDI